VLAYCIAEQKSHIHTPRTGVEAAPVGWIDVDRLRCFVSDFGGEMPNAPVPEMVKAFNHVLQRIFAQTVIIPFRFPTIVESEAVLRQFVASRAAEYSSALHRLRDKVQMDLRITAKPGAREDSRQSGKAYLQQRRACHEEAQSVLQEFRRVSHSLAEEWVQRDSTSGIRGFALVDRSSLAAFLEKIARVVIPAGVSARVTGPWPPSEFVEIAHE
jgi:hypothetical protein